MKQSTKIVKQCEKPEIAKDVPQAMLAYLNASKSGVPTRLVQTVRRVG